jgi:hypothetical protein
LAGAICLSAGAGWLAQPATGQPEDDAWFADRSQEAGLSFVYENGAAGRLYFHEMMGGGAALLDYDRDGDLDVYLPQGSVLGEAEEAPALSDRLFRNDTWRDTGGVTHLAFVDVSRVAGLPAGDYGMGVASADIDNDGWPDLYLTNFGANRLLRNRGDGTFADITAGSGVEEPRWSLAASFFDPPIARATPIPGCSTTVVRGALRALPTGCSGISAAESSRTSPSAPGSVMSQRPAWAR